MGKGAANFGGEVVEEVPAPGVADEEGGREGSGLREGTLGAPDGVTCIGKPCSSIEADPKPAEIRL